MAITPRYYAVLGVTQTATTNEVIRAYKFRASEAQRRKAIGLQAVDHHSLWVAYDTLRDEGRRRAYDPTYTPPNAAALAAEQQEHGPTWENNMFARSPEDLEDPFIRYGYAVPPGYRPLGLPGDSNDPIYRLNNRVVDLGTAQTNRVGETGDSKAPSQPSPTANKGLGQEKVAPLKKSAKRKGKQHPEASSTKQVKVVLERSNDGAASKKTGRIRSVTSNVGGVKVGLEESKEVEAAQEGTKVKTKLKVEVEVEKGMEVEVEVMAKEKEDGS